MDSPQYWEVGGGPLLLNNSLYLSDTPAAFFSIGFWRVKNDHKYFDAPSMKRKCLCPLLLKLCSDIALLNRIWQKTTCNSFWVCLKKWAGLICLFVAVVILVPFFLEAVGSHIQSLTTLRPSWQKDHGLTCHLTIPGDPNLPACSTKGLDMWMKPPWAVWNTPPTSWIYQETSVYVTWNRRVTQLSTGQNSCPTRCEI